MSDAYFEKARALAEKIDATPNQLIRIYIELAKCKIETADLTTAHSMLQYVIEMAAQNSPQDAYLLGRCHAMFGVIHYYQKEYQKAIEKCNEAISYFRKDGNDQELDPLYSLIASSLIGLKQYPPALYNINKAIAILKNQGPDSKLIADRYLVKGSCFERLGNTDSALFYFRRTAVIRYKILGINSVYVFGAYYTLGQFFERTERFDSATAYYQKSLGSLVNDFGSLDWEVNPKPQTGESDPNLFLALNAKARVLKRLADGRSSAEKELRASLSSFLLADSVLNVYRRNSVYDDSQLELKARYQIPYEIAMDVAYTMFQRSKNSKHFDHALRIMESSRAALLQDALRRAEAYSLTGLPRELKQKENELVRRRAGLLTEMEKKFRNKVWILFQRSC